MSSMLAVGMIDVGVTGTCELCGRDGLSGMKKPPSTLTWSRDTGRDDDADADDDDDCGGGGGCSGSVGGGNIRRVSMSVDFERVSPSRDTLPLPPSPAATAPRAVLLSVRHMVPSFDSPSALLFSRLSAKRFRSDDVLELIEPVLE